MKGSDVMWSVRSRKTNTDGHGLLLVGLVIVAVLVEGPASAQHPKHNRLPRTSVQQSWVRDVPAIIYILSRYDLIQAPLEPSSVAAIKAINPAALVLPFDSMGDAGLPQVWYTGEMISSSRPKEDVTDSCPVYHGEGSSRGVTFDGKIFQDWKAEVSVGWRNQGMDGSYLDLWNKYKSPKEILGLTHLAEKMRRLWPDGLLIVNAAGAIDFSYANNGFMYEDYNVPLWRPEGFAFTLSEIDNWVASSAQPAMIIMNQRSWGLSDDWFWRRARFTIAISLLRDALYASYNWGHGGSPHWANSWWFDELDVELGVPLGPATRLGNGVYVRKFSKGAVLVNAEGEPKIVTAADLGETYYHFRGGQQPALNDGSEFDSVVLQSGGLDRYHGIGDGVILVKEPQTVVAEIIIDDEAGDQVLNNNISGSFTQSGMIFDSNGYNRWPDSWRVYPANSCYYASSGNGEAIARWTPVIGVPGKYEVFEWHPAAPGNASNAPYIIRHSRGETTVRMDQRTNGGRWNSLGVFEFAAGRGGYVEVSNQADGTVFADAIRLVYREGTSTTDQQPPSPPKGLRVKR